MAKKMAGKVVAGVALGGASLLVFTPAMALAAGDHEGGDGGRVYASPDAVRAGDRVKLIEVCEKPQQHPSVRSAVTDEVELHPARKDHGDEQGHDPDQRGEDGKDQQDGEEPGRDDHGPGPAGGSAYPKPPADGLGGGLPETPSAEEDHDFTGHEEYGQDREHGKDFVYHGEATLSAGAMPGTYKLAGSCGEGRLTVLPTGSVDGGDGGMTTTSTDGGLAAGGASLLGVAALGGIVLLRRRRTDGPF